MIVDMKDDIMDPVAVAQPAITKTKCAQIELSQGFYALFLRSCLATPSVLKYSSEDRICLASIKQALGLDDGQEHKLIKKVKSRWIQVKERWHDNDLRTQSQMISQDQIQSMNDPKPLQKDRQNKGKAKHQKSHPQRIGISVLVFNQGDDIIACLNKTTGLLYNKFKEGKDKVMLEIAIRVMLLVQGEIMQEGRQGWLNVITIMTEDLDAYDSDYDDVSNAKTVLMANLSNYGSDKAQRIKPTLYDGSVISSQHVASPVFDDEETLILEEAPQELPKVSLVNTSLKKFKYHLCQFDAVVKKRITPDAITEGEWGFEHMKTVFLNEIIPFLKNLKDISNGFDKDILNEVMKVQIVFNQMEAAIQQYFVDKQCFEIHNKELFLENDRLLQKIMSQDVMTCVMNFIAVFDDMNVEIQSSESCVKCLDLDAELLNKQNAYNNHSKTRLQAKDSTICKLKEHIKSMRENDKEEKVKHKMDETETINIELEHSVAKLLSKNERLNKEIEHLKMIYKDQFDLIKKTRAISKEHDDSLIAQLNSKYMKNVDLQCQIQDKVFVITSLKNNLQKIKRKESVENAAQIPIATTIAPGMFKIDLEPLAPRLLNNREAHIDYLKHTQEQAGILQGIMC
ncbi:hypothetical protein Tco_1493365 [Tanacetum coccineum]